MSAFGPFETSLPQPSDNIKRNLAQIPLRFTPSITTCNDLNDRKEFFRGPLTFRRYPSNLSLWISHSRNDGNLILDARL